MDRLHKDMNANICVRVCACVIQGAPALCSVLPGIRSRLIMALYWMSG